MMKSGRQDSNLRHPGPKPGALPTALRPDALKAGAKLLKKLHPCKFFRNYLLNDTLLDENFLQGDD